MTLRQTRLKATASHKNLQDTELELVREYRFYTEDILTAPEFLQLADFRHHAIDRRQHVLNVSWYAFLLARRLGMDTAAAARAGLLHDLYYYNFRDEAVGKNEHIYNHPRLALTNARELTELSAREEDIILNHMWPMCPQRGRHFKETYLVSLVDKACCLMELTGAAGTFAKMRLLRYFKEVRHVRQN